jgi:hypothetical protein
VSQTARTAPPEEDAMTKQAKQYLADLKAVDVEMIESLKGAALKQKYQEVLGAETKSNNRPFLIRKIVDALQSGTSVPQSEAAGPAQAEAEPVMAKVAQSLPRKPHHHGQSTRDSRLPDVGAVLEREYDGKKIRVRVLADGFEYRGKTYNSLSAVANEATGTTWNGFLFFRLIPYAKRVRAEKK